MDPDKIRERYEERGRRAGRIDAVLDASPHISVRRANIYRDYITRNAVVRAVQPAPADRILDYGCGTGRLSLEMARYAREVHGVDIADSMLQQARNWAQETRLGNVTFGRPESATGQFQKAFTFGVMCHHDDQALEIALANLRGLIEPGGRLFLLEQVRSEEKTFEDFYRQRARAAYPEFADRAGFRLVRQQPVFRMPSYGLALWNRWPFPKSLLFALELIERATVDRKPEHIDYETRVFELANP